MSIIGRSSGMSSFVNSIGLSGSIGIQRLLGRFIG